MNESIDDWAIVTKDALQPFVSPEDWRRGRIAQRIGWAVTILDPTISVVMRLGRPDAGYASVFPGALERLLSAMGVAR